VVAALAALGLVLRLLVARDLASSPLLRAPLLDAAAYDRWARAIAAGDLAGQGGVHLAPLYPYLCGLVYALAPDGPLAVVLLQHLAGAGLAVAAGAMAGALGGPLAAAVAAFLVAGYGPLVAYENVLLAEVLGAVLLTAGVGLLALGAEGAAVRSRLAFAAGFLLGLDALVRPTGLLVAAALAVWTLARAPGRRGRAALALAAGAALAVAPVTLRNRVAGGEWVLVTASGGFNFYVGNHPGADGSYVQPEGVPFVPGDAGGDPTGKVAAERALDRPLRAGEVSRYWRERALDFIRAEPGRAVLLFLRKVGLVWNRVEIPQIVRFEDFRQESATLRRLPLAGPRLLLPLALLGLALGYPGAGRGRGVVRASLAAFTLATALFFVTDRYRIQAVPLMAVAAGGAVARLAELARWPARAPLARALAGLALAVVAVEPVWVGLRGPVGHPWLGPMNRAVGLAATGGDSAAVEAAFAEAVARGPEVARVFANRGEWRRGRGALAAAAADLRRAVELDPGDPMAWTALGRTLGAAGDDPAAGASLERAHGLDPTYAPAALALGQALVRLGRAGEAMAPLRAALAGPDSAAAHDALGLALVVTGDRAAGLAHLRQAAAIAPARAAYHLHLGLALSDSGVADEALTALATAAAADPAYRPARLALAELALERGAIDMARREVAALLARDPADPEARALDARLPGPAGPAPR
jgi:lipoprotein NlpI